MNLIATFFVTVGVIFDTGVWYYVKDLKIFDEEVEEELELADKEKKVPIEEPLS